jgi:hypothetical protein
LHDPNLSMEEFYVLRYKRINKKNKRQVARFRLIWGS